MTATLAASVRPRIVPSGKGIGADVFDVRLDEELDAQAIADIKAAWYQHLVLRFRGQQLSDADLIAFTRRLGVLDRAPARSASRLLGVPEEEYVIIISNVKENGQPIGELGDSEAFWHQDMTYHEKPPVGAALYALEIPPSGGNTQFCDLYQAYETLPADLRQRVDGLSCIHDITLDSSGRPRKGHEPTTDPRQAKGPTHPLVHTHPHTKRRHLMLGRRPFAYIPGLSLEDSEALLDALWAHVRQPAFHWTQEWQLGDLILWDNRCTMHRRDSFDPSTRRVMHRTQLASD